MVFCLGIGIQEDMKLLKMKGCVTLAGAMTYGQMEDTATFWQQTAPTHWHMQHITSMQEVTQGSKGNSMRLIGVQRDRIKRVKAIMKEVAKRTKTKELVEVWAPGMARETAAAVVGAIDGMVGGIVMESTIQYAKCGPLSTNRDRVGVEEQENPVTFWPPWGNSGSKHL